MKHQLCLLLAAAMVLSLAGCHAPQEPVSTTQAPTAATTPSAPVETVPTTAEPTQPEPIRAAGSYKERYDTGASAESYLEYYLFFPENATPNMPLIIFLHGDGEIGLIDNLETYGMIESVREIYGNDFPFIALSPCTRTTSWIREDISQLLMGLIESVVDKYSIDESRIVITGHSRGAIGTWDLISRHGDFFSAAVPVSCNNENPLNLENCAKVPIWAFAGDQGRIEERYCEFMSEAVDAINRAGGNAQFTALEDHFHIDTDTGAYTREVFDWMLSFGEPEETVPTEPIVTEPLPTEPPQTTETIPPITESVTMPVLYGDPLGIVAGTYQETYHSNMYGRDMQYCMFVPEDAAEDMPLIVYLHGDSEVGRIDEVADIEMVKAAKEIYGEAFPFLVLAPNTTEKSWIDFHVFNTVFDLIEQIAADYKVDPDKIILTGHSRGAIGTWYYLNLNYYYTSFSSDISFSCAVPVSYYAAYPLNPELSAKLPIRAFVGDGDTVELDSMEKMKEEIRLIQEAGGDATLTVLEGSTHGQTEKSAYTKETFQWMLAQ